MLAFFTFTVEEGQGAGAAPVDVTCHLLGPHVRTRGIIVEQREWHAMTAAPASLGYPGACLALVLALGAQRSPLVGPSRPSPSELAPALLPFAVLRRSRGLRRVRRAVLCCAVCVCVCAGHAIVMESSGHVFDPHVSTKILAPWTASADSANGDPHYFLEQLLPLCARADVEGE